MHIAHKNDCMQITKFMLLLCSLHSHTLTQIDEWSLARDTFWENERKIESGWKQWQAAMHLKIAYELCSLRGTNNTQTPKHVIQLKLAASKN